MTHRSQRLTPTIIILILTLAIAGCGSAGPASGATTSPPRTSAEASKTTLAAEPDSSVPATAVLTTPPTIAEITTVATIAPTATTTTLDPTTGFPAGVAGGIPNGSYRVEVTDADLAAVNVPPENRPENEGTFTWTLTDGLWSNLQTADHPIQYPTASGVYIADGEHVTFFVASDLGPQEFTWKVEPNGDLILTAQASTSSFYAAFLGAHPLMKVS